MKRNRLEEGKDLQKVKTEVKEASNILATVNFCARMKKCFIWIDKMRRIMEESKNCEYLIVAIGPCIVACIVLPSLSRRKCSLSSDHCIFCRMDDNQEDNYSEDFCNGINNSYFEEEMVWNDYRTVE